MLAYLQCPAAPAFAESTMLHRILMSLLLSFITSLNSELQGASNYQVDRSIFEKHPNVAASYLRLQEGFEAGTLTRAQHHTRLDALQSLVAREPSWVDGYWLVSAEAFVLASSYEKPKELALGLPILDEGIRSAERCLQFDSAHIMCKFFLASSMARKASIQGIFASLRLGQRIHDLWMDVLASPYDFWFRPNVSLQGSVRYGLGIFYRLVPNQWLMETMFRIRGSLDKSVSLHREAVAINPEDPCARLMLGTALLCRCRGDQKDKDCHEGLSWLEKAHQSEALDLNQRLCQRDGMRLLKEQDLACGYTQARQADDPEKAVF
jgi:hypothetical protein